MNERNIPDVWKVFGTENKSRPRRNSWQKMITEEEKTITDLFSDIHLHAKDVPADIYDDEDNNRKNAANNSRTASDSNKEWQNMEKHLSMKKTIRKKMMRDLKQAILDSEAGECNVHIAPRKSTGAEPNLLELLKNSDNPETNKPEVTKKPGFWAKFTMRSKSKR